MDPNFHLCLTSAFSVPCTVRISGDILEVAFERAVARRCDLRNSCLEAVALLSEPAGFDLRLGPCGVCHAVGRRGGWDVGDECIPYFTFIRCLHAFLFSAAGAIDMHTWIQSFIRVNLALLSAVSCPYFSDNFESCIWACCRAPV